MKTLLFLLSTTLLAQQTQVDYLRQLKNQPLLISDNNYGITSLTQLCSQATAAGATPVIGKAWKNVSSVTLGCAFQILSGGSIQPGSGQTVTFSVVAPPLAMLCDISLGGVCNITGSTGVVYPQWWGALGDGAHDDTAAVRSAAIAACTSTSPAEMMFPAGTYLISGVNPISASGICDGLVVTGMGKPQINYTAASGAFLLNDGHRNVIVRGLSIYGSYRGGTWAIRHIPNTGTPVTALNCTYTQNTIQNFGDGSSGAGISIESDSLGLTISRNVMGNLTANISITAPTDTLDIQNNTLTTPTANSGAGPVRCVDFSGETGAATIRVTHNNMTCEGYGALRIQSGAGGFYTISHNESETLKPISNASNSVFEILGGNTIVTNNVLNSHSQTGGNYTIYVGDSVSNSIFEFNTATGFLTKGIRVGSGISNLYDNNLSSSGVSTLYSSDYLGIRQIDSTATPGAGVTFGCAASAALNFSFCFPDTTIASNQGGHTWRSTSVPAVNMKFGLDSSAGTAGRAFWSAVHDGATYIPLQVNPSGGGVSLNGPATNSGLVEINGNATQSGTLNQTTSVGIGNRSVNLLTDTGASFVGHLYQADVAQVIVAAFKTGYVGGPYGAIGTVTNHDVLFRSNDIERLRITKAGPIIFDPSAIPLSCAGQASRTLWSNGGVLQVCP